MAAFHINLLAAVGAVGTVGKRIYDRMARIFFVRKAYLDYYGFAAQTSESL
jgi:hypothetical protein